MARQRERAGEGLPHVVWIRFVTPALDARGHSGFVAVAGSVLGAALQLQQPALWPQGIYIVLTVAAFVAWAAVRKARRVGWAALAVALLAGTMLGAGLAGWRASVYARDVLSSDIEGLDLQLEGVVAQMPQPGERGTRFRFDVESARTLAPQDSEGKAPRAGSAVRVPPRVVLTWYRTSLENDSDADRLTAVGASASPVHAGERWRFTVRLRAPHGTLNPHGSDFELNLWEQGVQATGYVRSGAHDVRPERLGASWRHPVERAREILRDKVFERVADRPSAGVVAALLTGDQNAIERDDWSVFRATGVAHLMSISGLHITMFAWLAAAAVGAAWRRSGRLMLAWPAQHAALAGGVLLATLYAVFSGWGLPSQRTVWMLATVALLRLSGARWPWPWVWLCTCAVVVAFDPWALMQAGFWLSFVAVGVLFAAGRAAHEGTEGVDAANDPRRGLAARWARLWREQWVVTLALTPLVLMLFHQVSLIGLVANAIAIPVVTLVITPLAMLGAVLAPLWQLAAWAVEALATLLRWLAALPFASLSMAAPAAWATVAGVGGGVLLAMRLPMAVRLLGVPLLLPALLWHVPRPVPGEFELLGVDIGQGNAVLVRTATHSLLYDAGPAYGAQGDAGERVLVPLMQAMAETLNTVVLSHRDSDHTGGAASVLEAQPAARLRSSIEPGHPLQALRRSERCVAGQRWRWDGVDFELLHPLDADYAAQRKPNDLSCVLRVGNGRAAVLLTGDIESAQEAALVARGEPLQADVLLVPHHGSKTSSSAALLDAVRPRIALVQAGYRNRFGHPAAEVVARYRERGVAVVDSAHCGAARWTSEHPG
ncbi:MAG: DNA internalization-related competence protein ComEC/Rec2, partial [Gammaproteobacteria bacterium]|nr:DNA internalization-related competence protein ComEC/Rec2 [Gammaproteobacteria bacterium]